MNYMLFYNYILLQFIFVSILNTQWTNVLVAQKRTVHNNTKIITTFKHLY